MTKPWSSWSRIDRNHPRIRARGSKWRRDQQEAAVGDRIRSSSGRYHPETRASSLCSAEAPPAAEAVRQRAPRWNQLNRAGVAAELGEEQLAAPNSSTNPDLGSTKLKRIGAVVVVVGDGI